MARKRQPTEINLSIDFGRRVYHEGNTKEDNASLFNASMYEAKDIKSGTKLLVFFTDEACKSSGSIDIAREIRKSCEKINLASAEIPALCPILDSGLTELGQAFFMSQKPIAKPLILKEYDSINLLIDDAKKITEIVSIVHSLGLTQYKFNLKSEWFEKEDSSIILLFPGVRGLLERLNSNSFESLKVDLVTDLKQLCNTVIELSLQLSVEIEDELLDRIKKSIESFKSNISHNSKISDFSNLLDEILLDISIPSFAKKTKRDRSKTVILDDLEELSSYDSRGNDISEKVLTSAFQAEEDFNLIDKNSSSQSLSESLIDVTETDVESDLKRETFSNFEAKTSGVEVFDSFDDPSRSAIGKKSHDSEYSLSSENISGKASERFSRFTENVYEDSDLNSKRTNLESNNSYLKDYSSEGLYSDNAKKSKILISLALVLLILIILLIVFIFKTLITSGDNNSDLKPDSLKVFDHSSENRMIDEIPIKDNLPTELEKDDAPINKVIELEEAFTNQLELSSGAVEAKENKNNTDNVSDSKEPQALFDVDPVDDQLDIKLFLENISTPIPSRDVSQVISLLESKDFEVRIAAVKTLGEKAVKDDVRIKIAIESMLNDEDPLVRGFASFALVSYSDEDAVAILEDQLTYEKNDVVKSAIKRAIEKAKRGSR